MERIYFCKVTTAARKESASHLGNSGIGIVAILLTVLIGIQTNHSERDATANQIKLNDELAVANKKLEQSHDSEEYMKGQFSVIASLIQKGNKDDLQQLAVAISDSLHPQQPSPCLHPVRYTTSPIKSTLPTEMYAAFFTIPNPNGLKAPTSFQVFFWDEINYEEPTQEMHDYIPGGGGGGSGFKIVSIVTQADVPKGQPITYRLYSMTVPVRVRCVDLVATQQK